MRENIIPAADVGTLYDLLRARVEIMPKAVAYRQYDPASGKWGRMKWQDVLARVDRFASAFLAAGLTPGDRIAILLQNCVDWICFDMAAHRCGLLVVPLYVNDAVSNGAFMLADSRPRLVFVDDDRRWRALSEALLDDSFIEHVWLQKVTADFVPGADVRAEHIEAVLLAEGSSGALPPAFQDSDASATLIYTSGTTGDPKGVMLSHRAILENAEAVARVVPPFETDVFLSILPLAHAFERTMGYVLPVMAGACVAYAQSLLRLRQDMATVRPTVIMGVPRFYETIYGTARRSAAKSALGEKLFDATARIGWERCAAKAGFGAAPRLRDRLLWPLLDRLVARKVGAAFGGRMRVAVSGGANFPAEIGQALLGLGIPMVEGYGLSEAGPVVTASAQADCRPGSVGFALPGIETKQTARGELLIRTPACMCGYWQREDAAREMLDADGWLRTGDLAEIENGRITISGRLKHILVMSNGENVNPRPIETAIEGDPLFEQVCAVGDGRPFISALLVLNREGWQALAAAEGLDPNALNTPAAEKVLLTRIRSHLKDVPAWQQVKACHATLDEWTVESRLITPTLKLRRERVIEAFRDEIRAIYAGG